MSYNVFQRLHIVIRVFRKNNCENIPRVVTPPFHAASLPPLYIQYTTPFTDPSKNFL